MGKGFSFVFFLMLLLCIAGCHSRAIKQQGSEIATVGVSTSEQLARFYESLADDTVDSHEFNAFREGVVDVEVIEGADKRDQTLTENLAALKSRALLAAKMKGVYEALGALSGSDTATATRTAAEGLAGAVLAVRSAPLADPSANGTKTLVGLIAEDLMLYLQSKEILKAEKLARELEKSLQELFEIEKETYQSIARFRAEKAGTVALGMLSRKELNPWPLIQRVLLPYGVVVQDTKAFPANADTLKGFEKLLIARTRRLARLSDLASSDMAGGLSKLAKAHSEFPVTRSLDDAIANTQRVKAYLDAMALIRNH
ncbi:MAG: hypothetical protein AB7E72_09690 [Lysobacterales bacterium]